MAITISDFQKATGFVVEDYGSKPGVLDAGDRMLKPNSSAGVTDISFAEAVEKYHQAVATDTSTTSSAAIRRQFQLPVRVGGWSGIHDYLVLPQLADRAEAAGVKIELEVADKHWWKGTLYNVNVEGATENVERFIALTLRDPVILP